MNPPPVEIGCAMTNPANPHTAASIGAHFGVQILRIERQAGLVSLFPATEWNPTAEDRAALREMLEIGQPAE